MIGTASKIDLKKVLLDRSSVYSSPEQFRDYPGLTKEQKIDILRSLAYEASEIAVAEEEGMISREPLRIAETLSVLHELTGGYDVEHSPLPPNKKEIKLA